jgi:hypothetical protein
MATLKATTVLEDPDTHEPVVLLAGTEAPDWAAKAITNPEVLDQSDDDGDTPPEGEPNADWKVDALKAYAEEHDIDLDGATKKDDILKRLTDA